MDTYLIGFISEFEDYILILNFEKQFANFDSATSFSDSSVQYIAVGENGINLIIGSDAEKTKILTKYRFKRLIASRPKPPPLSKDDIDMMQEKIPVSDFRSFIFSNRFILDEERDYIEINVTPKQMYRQLCKEYGYASCFNFSIASYSVELRQQ